MILGLYFDLLNSSFNESLTVISYSLNLIVSAISENSSEVNTLVTCIKKILMDETQNLWILHNVYLFVIKHNTVSYIMI